MTEDALEEVEVVGRWRVALGNAASASWNREVVEGAVAGGAGRYEDDEEEAEAEADGVEKRLPVEEESG